MDSFLKKLDNCILFLIIYTLAFFIFFGTLNYTLPFVIAFSFAYFLQTPTKYLISKFHFKNSTASLITTTIFYTLLLSLLTWFIFLLTSESIQLGKNAQTYVFRNGDYFSVFFNTIQKQYNKLNPIIIYTLEKNISLYSLKTLAFTVSISSKLISKFLKLLSSIPYIVIIALFSMISTYFFTKDLLSLAKNAIFTLLPSSKAYKLFFILSETKKILAKCFLSYFIIISITFIITLIGFLTFHVKYSLILAILTAICDLLPILGSWCIYIPIAIIFFLSKNYFAAVGLFLLLILVSIVRQILEPKMLSSTLGIHPIAILVAFYVGLQANGFYGIIFCLFLVIFYTILKTLKLL